MFKKYFYVLLLLIMGSVTHSMELTTYFPDDIQHIIFSYALSNWHHNEERFQESAHTSAALQLTCKKFAPFATIASYIQVNDSNKNIFLLRAAQAGVPCLVSYAINEKRADLNCTENWLGYTPLSSAVRCNNYKCCEILLEAGADVNKAEEDKEEKDHRAIDIPYIPTNYQPIHLAAINNNIKIIELLLAYKANINATTSFHDSAFDIAHKMNIDNKKLLDFLIQHGADTPYNMGLTHHILLNMQKLKDLFMWNL